RLGLPAGYSFSDYSLSLQYIREKVEAFRPDRVVSDNLVGALRDRADALLMGSFLWSDVLVGSSVYQEIAHFEHKLLQEYEPIMIGVEDIAMPGVKQRTRFIGLPWFCDPYNGRSNNISGETYRKQVLVTGGGTNVLGS